MNANQIQNQTPLGKKAAVTMGTTVAGSGEAPATNEEKPLNHYEARQERRRERYEALAAKAQRESGETYNRARDMASVIPFGQPILVGHHSEGRDRRYRGKIHDTFGKAFALDDKAKYYENKAASVGAAGISGDDPDAIAKLKEELAGCQARVDLIKAARQVVGKSKTYELALEALTKAGFENPTRYLTQGTTTYWFHGTITRINIQANMRRIKERIELLEKMQQRESKEEQGQGYTYREDTDENRIMFIFDGKPSEAIRKVLKGHAFKWSPTRGAWVRQMTPNALWAAGHARAEINALVKG
jgi:hypothetical protein